LPIGGTLSPIAADNPLFIRDLLGIILSPKCCEQNMERVEGEVAERVMQAGMSATAI
jgi:hypothetical protein